MSLNLHGIVRTAINFNNADETVLLVRSLGNANVQGRIVPTYGEPESVGAQVQTLGGEDLKVINDTERTPRDRKFYLYSTADYTAAPAGMIRYLGRTGDFIYRPLDGTYWKVYQVAEDFSPAGWVQLLASQQTEIPPQLVEVMDKYFNPEEPGEGGGNE